AYPDAIGAVQQSRVAIDRAAFVAEAEMQAIAVAGEREAGGAAVRILLRVAERREQAAVRAAEDAEPERETVVERRDDAVPGAVAAAAQQDRRGESLTRAARIAPVRGRARGLEPEAAQQPPALLQ